MGGCGALDVRGNHNSHKPGYSPNPSGSCQNTNMPSSQPRTCTLFTTSPMPRLPRMQHKFWLIAEHAQCPFLPRCQAIMPPSPVRHKPARCPPPPHVQCNMQLPPKRTRICHCQCHQTTAATLRWWRGAPSARWLRTGLLLRCRCRHRDQHLLGQRRLFFIRCTASNAILRKMWH